ncbi:guanine deaminase [uncultured Clostridium sp.]|uniref:guanine deaminase n=1 Tax=uncultured Clostridium sp. TaxID=59620 RepID=UPI0025E3CD93|nr:guanine deaminase [uncultured Clostridium sp.]
MENMKKEILIIKGNIVFTEESSRFSIFEKSYIIVSDGYVEGIYKEIPKEYENIEVQDYGDNIIIPGFVDLHVHAPQYSLCGLGYDKTLLQWLNNYTFKEEAKFKDVSYAEKVYKDFVQDLYDNGTTRSVIFGTIHRKSTEILMDLLNEKGLSAYVGKVNMDINSPDYLMESEEESVEETEKWIGEYKDKYKNVKPIITPRFVPSCSSKLLKELGRVAHENNLPVQSHLSENVSEIQWVKELHPESKSYGHVYDMYGLFGQTKTVMAHCIHLSEDELERIKKNEVFIAHCPNSNVNISSGIAFINRLMSENYNVGLGSDLAGGEKISMLSNIADTIKLSKIRTMDYKDGSRPLTSSEGFYLATKGGGKFFGKVGSFEKGYEFDALVIDDKNLWKYYDGTIEERMEKLIYLGDSNNIVARYCFGKEI